MFRPLPGLVILLSLPFTLTLAYWNTTTPVPTSAANIVAAATAALERPARSPGSDGGPRYDDHTQPHAHVTLAQLTFFLSCAAVSALWLLARLTRVLRKPLPEGAAAADREPDEAEKGLLREIQLHSGTARTNGEATSSSLRGIGGDAAAASQTAGGDVGPGNDVKAEAASSSTSRPSAPPVPSVDEILQGVAEFGVIMFYFFLCDYIKIVPEEPRVYNRDQFLFFIFVVFAVGFAFTMKTNKDIILGRDQTEEWKGWMQLMFVWYHYFAAKEWYNWIRIYIACYVWMTGFGNFSFFWMRGDYSLWRVLKMLFRMNFLVIAVVVVTANEYMLYYICAMHTYWFLTVYLFMRTLTSWNTHRWKMAAKFAAYVVCNALIFDIPGVASFLFRPLWFVFQFHDDVHDVMHEWEFRAGLDHWACLLGMLCAYNYPHLETLLRHLDTASHSPKEAKRKLLVRAGLGAGGVLLGLSWYFAFMRAEKLAYNRLHPYTSLLPILAYLLLRNLHPALRRRHLGLLAALGRITLETYLSQLHVYLQSNAKHLLGYLPGYPLLTFALATIVYLLISKRLFELTLRFSAFFIQKEWGKSLKSVVVGIAAVGVSLCLSAGVLWSRGTL